MTTWRTCTGCASMYPDTEWHICRGPASIDLPQMPPAGLPEWIGAVVDVDDPEIGVTTWTRIVRAGTDRAVSEPDRCWVRDLPDEQPDLESCSDDWIEARNWRRRSYGASS